jgi:hypothetical protein
LIFSSKLLSYDISICSLESSIIKQGKHFS